MNSLYAQLDGTNVDIAGHDLFQPAFRFDDEIAVIIDIGAVPVNVRPMELTATLSEHTDKARHCTKMGANPS